MIHFLNKHRFLFFAVVYSFGYAFLEYYLQGRGISEASLAQLSLYHNLLSVIICAVIFLKCSNQVFTRWLWAVGFMLLIGADIIHALFFWVIHTPHNNLITYVGDKLYVLFALLHCVAFIIVFRVTPFRRSDVPIFAIAALFAGIAFWKISYPYWLTNPPLWETIPDGVYNVATALIVGICLIRGTVVSSQYGFLICAAYLLILFSDFAIRYYDTVQYAPQLGAFTYGWELGFSVIALSIYHAYRRGLNQSAIFASLSINSVRFYVAGVSLVTLVFFAAVFLGIVTDVVLLRAIDVSVLLFAFLLSWTLANVASFWGSIRLSRFRRLLVEGNTSAEHISVEIADLLKIYEQKNEHLSQALCTIQKQREDIKKVFNNVAHDIRSPLSVLKTYVEVTAEAGGIETLFKDAARNSVLRVEQLSDDLRDYARASQTEKKDVSLKELVQKSAIPFMLDAEVGKRYHVNANVQEDIYFPCDDQKLSRVLTNLIQNSVEAVAPGSGEIEVSAELRDRNTVEILVRDNGMGIQEDERDQVFDAYFSKREEGLGLGLSYCKEVVEAHGGTISVESVVGSGTTMKIVIPNA